MMGKRSVPPGLYDKEYFLTNCGGFREFAESGGSIIPERLLYAFEAAEIKAGMKVADIGCGRGELVLRAAGKGANVLGVDYSEEALKLAEELLSRSTVPAGRVRLLKADVNELLLEPGTFDVIFMTDLAEHLYPEELAALLGNVLRALKPGGRLVAHTAPNRWFCRYGWTVVRRVVLLKEKLLGTNRPVPVTHPSMTGINEKVHVNLQDPRGFRKTLRRAGFQYARIFFREEGPLSGKSVWNRVLNRLFRLPGVNAFFCISIFAVAGKRG